MSRFCKRSMSIQIDNSFDALNVNLFHFHKFQSFQSISDFKQISIFDHLNSTVFVQSIFFIVFASIHCTTRDIHHRQNEQLRLQIARRIDCWTYEHRKCCWWKTIRNATKIDECEWIQTTNWISTKITCHLMKFFKYTCVIKKFISKWFRNNRIFYTRK